MGIFHRSKSGVEKTYAQRADIATFERDLTQVVVMKMYSMRMISVPGLNYIKDAPGFVDGILLAHINDPKAEPLKKQQPDVYLNLLGCHALGAAMYILDCQHTFNKPVSEFGKAELNKIAKAFEKTDAYELGLNAVGIPYTSTSNNKKCFDAIVVTASDCAKRACPDIVDNRDYLKTYMNILFNAGVSFVYR